MSDYESPITPENTQNVKEFVEKLVGGGTKAVIFELLAIVPRYTHDGEWRTQNKTQIDYAKYMIKQLYDNNINVFIVTYGIDTTKHSETMNDLNLCLNDEPSKKIFVLINYRYDQSGMSGSDTIIKISDFYLKSIDYKYDENDFKHYTMNDGKIVYDFFKFDVIVFRLIEKLHGILPHEITFFSECTTIYNASANYFNSACARYGSNRIMIETLLNGGKIFNFTNHSRFSSTLNIYIKKNVIVIDETNKSKEQFSKDLVFAECLQKNWQHDTCYFNF